VRLFTAIDLDDEAREAVAGLQNRLGGAFGSKPSLKWIKPHHMHLTLVFLGEVPDDRAAMMAAAFSTDIAEPPFALTFQNLGVFPPRGAPRVLWLGVGQGAEALRQVQQQVATRLERLGAVLERRPFHPHLTLARWRHASPADAGPALGLNTGQPVARLDVRTVTLYQSRLTSAGPTYTVLARATLK